MNRTHPTPGATMILANAYGTERVTVVSLRLLGRVEIENHEGLRTIVQRSSLVWPEQAATARAMARRARAAMWPELEDPTL